MPDSSPTTVVQEDVRLRARAREIPIFEGARFADLIMQQLRERRVNF